MSIAYFVEIRSGKGARLADRQDLAQTADRPMAVDLPRESDKTSGPLADQKGLGERITQTLASSLLAETCSALDNVAGE